MLYKPEPELTMKTILSQLALVFFLFSTASLGASTTTFISNTEISPTNTNYDGEDIVISNCTVTVDGPHTFASLLVATNGILTHSFSTNGQLSLAFNVTNAPYVLNETNPTTLANTNIFSPLLVTDPGQTIIYTNGVDFLETNVVVLETNFSIDYIQIERTTNSAIPDGGTVLVSYSYYDDVPVGLDLTVTGAVWVAGGGAINADGIGYGAGFGPGAGTNSSGSNFDGSGGGDGGNGGMSAGNAMGGAGYDSLYQPAFAGSGGGGSYAGNGGNGGGLIQIISGGQMEIDGTISANGANATNSRAGGGSGGGIWISTASVSGAGSITANGGTGAPGVGGGGGGGHITIVCGANNFSGAMTAYGGSGANYGGAGTVFTQLTGQPGLLLVNNGGNIGNNSIVTLSNLADVIVSGNAVVAATSPFSPGNLTIGANSVLTGLAQGELQLSVSNDLTIESGGALSVDGLGYSSGGPGGGGTTSSGGYYFGGGGGHSGYGGLASVAYIGGSTYDLDVNPGGRGSAGGGDGVSSFGGGGGGLMRVSVSGVLQVDGRISANGFAGSGYAGGGGSGGGIYLSVGTFSGGGTVTVNGGNGAASLGGGGGGGCIAILCGTNNFSGTMTAYGGGGANYGGAGTVYLQPTGGSEQFILDNGGNVGAGTTLQTASQANLIVQNGAVGSISGYSLYYQTMLVASNAALTLSGIGITSGLTISSNATFKAGGGFIANSEGYIPGQGISYGTGQSQQYFPYAGGGGGNEGFGATATNGVAGGQGGYNVVTAPAYPGDPGGGFFPYSTGGNGGGYVRMIVDGTLQVNGNISANGGNGSGIGGGGGSGGAIYLTVGTLAGVGAIAANGGNGVDSTGGGGGGGCIAIDFNTNLFAGTLSAYGGGGVAYGGAGTIYLANYPVSASLTVDNGGNPGAGSIIQSAPTANVTVRNGGMAYASGSVSFASLLVSSNALLVTTNNSPLIITANNITVQTGGGLSANSAGYGANNGPGAGRYSTYYPYYPGGGGGNGGYGGNSFSNSASGGGAGFQAFIFATEPGSGGGGYSPYSIGGSGGGVIELNVSGTLAVNGSLSANGGNGAGSGGGGGSGGSLDLTIGSLTGTGVISANGGSGAIGIGGGGGGGMIAVNFESGTFSNLFTGTISAYGGGGVTNGGAGTVFIKTNYNNQATLIVDNGGSRGTTTPIIYSSSSYALILRNGAIADLTGYETFASLLITSNAWLVPVNVTGSGLNLTLYSNAVIQAGGGIIADSYGYGQNTGNGRGFSSAVYPWYPCSGAGHGGDGAFALSNDVSGGGTYDNILAPGTQGSGGGGYSINSVGGAGGGYINLLIEPNGALQLNGVISANGGNGSGSGGGGGSGGTINISAGSVSGNGSITANGGSGALNIGGGGGGGCIAITCGKIPQTNVFAGTVTAYGGGGASYGGAGTIYYRTNLQATALLLLDNGNYVGTNTPVSGTENVTVQNGAIGVLPLGYWAPINVLILSNSAMTTVAGVQDTFYPASLNIAQGGALYLDGRGYGAQSGPGAGSNFSSGAGHGGYGGGVSGGTAYDSVQSPSQEGSGGARSTSGVAGGVGGGALTVEVVSNLTVNGRLSANGAPGGFNAGGGAGGSLYLENIPVLAGNGIISANGGNASGSGGGGGGGRIALICTTNNFTGQISASGGAGTYPGGAGTAFTKVGGVQTLAVNNGGVAGANTPLSSGFSLPPTPFELDISGAASVVPLTPLPLLSNLNVLASSTLTMPVAQSNFFIGVLSNATIAGSLNVDHLGCPQTNGPGAGISIGNEGSGGGYGGSGGSSASSAAGGTTYGSAAEPTDFGSGGGNGADTATGGSDGGGALRLSVLGALNVSGNISANGNSGLQDDSGGGSGGSIWITVGTISGAGTISAAGGNGVLYGGGGGGGGRIALYTPTNDFTGVTNVNGGTGASPGQPGSVFVSSALSGFQIISQSPTGLVMNTVSYVNLNFDDLLNPASVASSDFTLLTPDGPLAATNLSVTVTGPGSAQVSFPAQNLLGTYTIEAATNLTDMFGTPLTQPYSGTFSVSLPAISGTVTATNGAGVAGVLLQPDGGLAGVTTDTNGNYTLGVPPGWNGTVTPALGANLFVPASLTYTNVTAPLTNQNYVTAQTVAPNLTANVSAGNFSMTWTGIPGVTYQLFWSTNLVTWQPLGSPVAGTNGPMQLQLPFGSNTAAYFQVNASY